MSLTQALALALLQGLTEFLPISSSAHLILLPKLTGWPDQGLVFDAAANTGTLVAVVLYFRRELRRFAVALGARLVAPRRALDSDERLAWMIAVATVPVGVCGLLLQDWVATQARNALLIAATSIGFGLLLGFADRFGRKELPLVGLSWRAATLIGLAQALALVPGTSRAGITVTAGLLAALSRDAAARFSFLLYIPVSLLVAVNDLRHLMRGEVPAGDLPALGLVLLGSTVVGYLVIELLLAWVRRQSLQVFVVYRVALGVAILVAA